MEIEGYALENTSSEYYEVDLYETKEAHMGIVKQWMSDLLKPFIGKKVRIIVIEFPEKVTTECQNVNKDGTCKHNGGNCIYSDENYHQCNGSDWWV